MTRTILQTIRYSVGFGTCLLLRGNVVVAVVTVVVVTVVVVVFIVAVPATVTVVVALAVAVTVTVPIVVAVTIIVEVAAIIAVVVVTIHDEKIEVSLGTSSNCLDWQRTSSRVFTKGKFFIRLEH